MRGKKHRGEEIRKSEDESSKSESQESNTQITDNSERRETGGWRKSHKFPDPKDICFQIKRNR